MVDIYFLADQKNLTSCYCCDPENADTSLHSDTTTTLQRLCVMLADPEAKQLINRHILLINHYMGLTKNQLKIFDMCYFVVALEYLCDEVNHEQLYETPLNAVLMMIQKPPIVLLSSHNEQYQSDLSKYFTGLANCYYLLKKHKHKFSIISAINNMLCLPRKEENLVNQQNCVWALENSEFAEIFSVILSTTRELPDLRNILDLLMHICTMSDIACLSMFEENFIDKLLNIVPSFSFELGNHTELRRTAFILLKILESALTSENYSLLEISQQALGNLRSWFKHRVLFGPKIKRNLLMTVILGIIQTHKTVDFASSMLLEDIILLSVSPVSVRQDTWTKDFELNNDLADHEFMKLLLLALHDLFDYCPTKILFSNHEGVVGLSQLFDLKLWPEVENNILLMYSLHLVPKAAKFLHEEIIKYDLITKMIIRSGKLVQRSDCDETFFYLIQSLYSLTLNEKLIQYFKEKNIIPPLLDYCETILEMDSWSLRVQLVLQYTLNSIVSIASKVDVIKFKCIRLSRPATLSTDLLKRYLNPSKNDSVFDPCLLVSIIDFIWIEQTKDEESVLEFLKSGGIYLLLDILEKETNRNPMQSSCVLLLGLLSDLLQDERAITQVATWHGTRYICLISLLCDLWRRAEKEKQVKRYQFAIEDCEAPLMGSFQASLDCLDPASCPPLLEMLGCLRPKIFSIISQLLNKHKRLVEVSEETYNVQPRRITTQDKITLKIIQNYESLKEGEIWQNMLRTMKRNNINILAGDEHLLHTLILKHIKNTRKIQQYQLQLLHKQSKQELEEERNLYENITINKVVDDLDKFRGIEKDLMIKNSKMRMFMKQVQLSRIEESFKNEWKKGDYIRTYNNKDTSTTLKMGRNIINSGFVTKI